MKNRFPGKSVQGFKSPLGFLFCNPEFSSRKESRLSIQQFHPFLRDCGKGTFSTSGCSSSSHIFYHDTLSHASSHIVIAPKNQP